MLDDLRWRFSWFLILQQPRWLARLDDGMAGGLLEAPSGKIQGEAHRQIWGSVRANLDWSCDELQHSLRSQS